jgi:phosphate transport system permease protein
MIHSRQTRNSQHGRGDAVFRLVTGAFAVLVLALVAAIFIELIRESAVSIDKFGIGFLWSAVWNPVTGEFGALSSIYGTLISTLIALLIAIPLSLVIALFLVELAPPFLARPVGRAIELLAAIPSIIFGMWGLFVFAPLMADHVQPFLQGIFGDLGLFSGPPMGIGILTAGIILALMVLPFTTAVMRDVFSLVPPVLKEAAYGMGSTTWEVTHKVTIRYGMRGLMGGFFLGFGRAFGETMAVTFVIGNDHRLSASLFAPGNTIASTLANEFSEASDPLYLSSLVELGLIMLVITLLMQLLANRFIKRLQGEAGGGA